MSADPFDVLLRSFEDFKADFRALVYEHNDLAKKMSSIAGQLRILYMLLTPIVIKIIIPPIIKVVEALG